MLTFPLPAHINGTLLESQLASAGIPSGVTVSGDLILMPDLSESDRVAAQPVVDAHPATAQALAATVATRATNEATISAAAADAIAANKAFLALSSPTNAQTLAQVKALSRQANSLIRLALRSFDSTD